MTKGVKPAEANCDDSVLDRNTVLSQKIGVAGTPTLIFPDGSRLGGVPSYENLVKALRERNPESNPGLLPENFSGRMPLRHHDPRGHGAFCRPAFSPAWFPEPQK